MRRRWNARYDSVHRELDKKGIESIKVGNKHQQQQEAVEGYLFAVDNDAQAYPFLDIYSSTKRDQLTWD